MNIMLGDLIEYVIKNRKGNAFKDWTWEQLFNGFYRGLKTLTLYYSENEQTGEIDGVVLGKLEDKNIYVEGLVTTGDKVYYKFVRKVHELYPEHTLTAHRHSKFKPYNTIKFKRKLHVI